MSKPKYSSKFKIMIAEAYLNGKGGFQCIANKYGVGVASVQLWGRCYQHHGKSGFGAAFFTVPFPFHARRHPC